MHSLQVQLHVGDVKGMGDLEITHCGGLDCHFLAGVRGPGGHRSGICEESFADSRDESAVCAGDVVVFPHHGVGFAGTCVCG